MKRTRRSPSPGFVKLVSLTVCYSLVTATGVIPGTSAAANESNSLRVSGPSFMAQSGLPGFPARLLGTLLTLVQGSGLPNVPGPNLPDLDVARQLQSAEPQALPPIASEQVCEDCAAPCPDCQINHKPIARTGGPYFGAATQAINFNGLGSFDPDPDDEISDFIWTFGDSTPAVEVHGGMPTHTYTVAGIYTVTLKVKDLANVSSDLVSTTATVNAGPTSTPTPAASPTPTPQQTNGATFISQTVATNMTAGQRYPVSLTMRNSGSTTWSAAHLYRLGSQSPQDNGSWGRARVYLPTAVAPGAEVTFSFTVLAPYSGSDEPPPVNFQWRMVQDGVGYFGDISQNQSVAIASNYQPPNGGAPQLGPFSDLFMSRIAVQHRTGQPGEDLLSGNYNWGLSLLDLPGRAGLDLNLGLSYNSLATWTKVEPPYLPLAPNRRLPTSWNFDADRGFPSVGFRLGFPTLQGPFTNVQTGSNAYLLLLPSGARRELRQIGSSNLYEAADSTYMQLIDGGNGGLQLRPTDGSQLAYLLINGEFRCTEIKDRNGNYVTIKYDLINGNANPGRMTSIIDTLGRTINFTYDQNYRLQAIAQLRSGQPPQVWATFGYSSIEVQPNFTATEEGRAGGGDLFAEAVENRETAVVGLPEQSTVSVLSQVGLADGSRYNFDYTSWGQVWRTHHYAADGNELSYTAYDLPQDNSHSQADCPRFTQRQDWVKNFNDDSLVTTTFQINPDGPWGKVTAPDGTAYQEFFATDYTAWQRGLVTRTETYSSASTTPKKTTITDWTQDNLSLAYPLNPRSIATTISDSDGNRRRTTVDYDSFGLPLDVFDLGPVGGAGWSLLRRTHTDYELSAAYVNQRIIGLAKQQFLFGPEDSGQRLYRKVSYEYDAGGEFLQDQGNPLQHDANYGTGSLVRGNVTKALRWDVNYETDIAHATTSFSGFNTSGSVVFSRDGHGHQTTISYANSFSTDGTDTTTAPGLTLAYPTTVTDPDGFSSTAKYHYNLGVLTRQQDPKGAAKNTEYDSAGRVKRVTNAVNGAYVRFVYPATQTIVNKFTTINELTGETYSATVLDGAARVRAVAGDFPNSNGHYSGQFTRYDSMGRAVQATNPTEMTNNWQATGPDDYVGWHSSSQTYDWKGRPLVSTNPDGTTKEATYGGCGCAGSEVVMLTDEGTIDGGTLKRRQRKIYSDSLGRTVKTEVLNWQGGSVYSATVNTYNARDEVESVRQYQGDEVNGIYQETTMNHDGFGRLKSQHIPEQDIGTATTYQYNPDDTVAAITDGRGASQTFSYNHRHLVTGVSYSAPSGVFAPSTAAFGYDPAGNRTYMTDGMGRMDYNYDQLSRLNSETRQLNDFPNHSYTIGYSYNLAGNLTSVTDPFGYQVSYTNDSTGRVTNISAPGSQGLPSSMSSIQYRAAGKMKQANFSWNGHVSTLSYSYDAQMEVTRFQISGASDTYGGQYQRHPDGKIKYAHDLLEPEFDRSYSFDQVGRVTQGLSGAEARGAATADGPYKQTYAYDAFDNLTSRGGRYWAQNVPTQVASFSNNRNPQATYDADGRPLLAGAQQFRYDAAGRPVVTTGTVLETYDGDGLRVKLPSNQTMYELRSTVLKGEVITGIGPQGQKSYTRIYAKGIRVGTNSVATDLNGNPTQDVFWELHSPTNSSSLAISAGSVVGREQEFSPIGDSVGTESPYLTGGDTEGGYPAYGDPSGFKCAFDYVQIDCNSLNKFYISKNRLNILTILVRQRVGSAVSHTTANLITGGSHAGNTVYGSAGPGGTPSTVEVIGEPDFFEVQSAGAMMQWLDLRPTQYLALVPQTSAPNPDRLKKAFYKLYQKKLMRCIWQVFSTDFDGHPMDTAQLMQRQTLRNAPNVDISQTMGQMGAQGYENDRTDPYNGKNGTIHIASNLPGWTTKTGQTISAQENYFRVYAHELGNLLSARYTGDGNTFGTRNGIVGSVSGSILDYDTGARLETCIFGDSAH